MSALLTTAILEGLKVGAAIEKISATKSEEQADLTALRSRMLEEEVAGTQKTIARDRAVRALVGHQLAVEATSGFETSSQSFKAITMDDFNKFADNRSNDALELDINKNQLQQDMLATKTQANAQIWGDVLTTAASVIKDTTGRFTNISKTTKPDTTKLVTPEGKSEFDDATAVAKEKRKSDTGLFDNLGE